MPRQIHRKDEVNCERTKPGVKLLQNPSFGCHCRRDRGVLEDDGMMAAQFIPCVPNNLCLKEAMGSSRVFPKRAWRDDSW
jgi:hypothetical protein